MTADTYCLPMKGNAKTNEHRDQVLAIMIAYGINLPERFDDFPVGLLSQWNDAARKGVFENTKTIGDMARALLTFRLNMLEG